LDKSSRRAGEADSTSKADGIGRHFASAEILTFIAAFTYLFDADVLSDTIKPNPQRIGLGIQQPMGSAKVRLRRRVK
jgi:cholesterol 7alpha-monooxygenase